MLIIILAAMAMAAGGLLGGLFVVAGRRRLSAEDTLTEVIDAELPQLQCAECGYAGCKPYARAIARKEAGIDLCLPGGEHTIRRLAEVINEPPPDASANESANNTIEVAYIRSEDCVGCALCLPVCPTDAIVGAARFSHSVVAKDCTGCKLCLPVCPTDAILMRPPQQRTALAQTLADYRKTAAPEPPPSQQCIRCNWCEEVCPAGLAPMRLYDLAQGGQWQESAAEGLAACIHCRRCDEVCPSAIPLSLTFARGKNALAKTARAKDEAARLKMRYESRQTRQTPPPPPKINAKEQAQAAIARVQK